MTTLGGLPSPVFSDWQQLQTCGWQDWKQRWSEPVRGPAPWKQPWSVALWALPSISAHMAGSSTCWARSRRVQ